MGDKVKVAIIGVGNCAAALIQGVHYYRQAPDDKFIPGLMHARVGDYHVGDIEFTAAFDIDAQKVGKDLSEAMWAGPNNTIKFYDVPHMGVPVYRGMTHDGLGRYLKERITKAPGMTDDIVGILKDTGTDVVINFLPVGSDMATKWYVQQILDAGCGMVNCIPVFIAREEYWQNRFKEHYDRYLADFKPPARGARIEIVRRSGRRVSCTVVSLADEAITVALAKGVRMTFKRPELSKTTRRKLFARDYASSRARERTIREKASDETTFE